LVLLADELLGLRDRFDEADANAGELQRAHKAQRQRRQSDLGGHRHQIEDTLACFGGHGRDSLSAAVLQRRRTRGQKRNAARAGTPIGVMAS
jgi:hypothetical protein